MVIYEKIADNRNYGAKRDTSNIKWIVMHYTANDGDTDTGNANYFATGYRGASAHYFVDDDSITRSVPDNYVAWSVGGAKWDDCGKTGGGKYYGQCNNSNSISIEMCDTIRDGRIDVTDKTLRNAANLCRSLMYKYNIDINHVICHFDVNGKHCPDFGNGAWIFGERKAFKRFKELVVNGMLTEQDVRNIVKEEIEAALKGYNTKPSSWAADKKLPDGTVVAGILTQAKDLGITDASRPKGYLTREEGAAMALKATKIAEDDGK